MSDPARVLAVHRYYWPDAPPYASLLRAILHRWQDSGARTEVFTTQPSYKPEAQIARRPRAERLDGTLVRRIALPRGRRSVSAALSMALFTSAAFLTVLKRRRDVVMCSTSPPVILAAAVSLAARLRGSAFVYHCMDIHPEIGALSGEFRNRYVFGLLTALDRSACRRAAAIVVLSEDMKLALLERDSTLVDRIVVLNNFDLPDYDRDTATAEETADRSRLRVVFTGNLGRFQGLEALTDAVSSVGDEIDVDLVLMGEGSAKADIQRRATLLSSSSRSRVELRPHGSPEAARALMRSADLGVVSLTPGVIRFAYPSKTATYLSEGLPLLVAVEDESQIASTVLEHRLGYVVPPNDRDAIAEVFRTVVKRPEDLVAMRSAAREFAVAEFGRDGALDRWEQLLERVLRGERPCP